MISNLFKRKYKLEKEHREIGLTKHDRPVMAHDNWNLDFTLAWLIYPRLLRFRRADAMGVPCEFMVLDESGKMLDEESTNAWHEVLDKMLYAFEDILLDTYSTNKQFDSYLDHAEKVQEGLDLFSKYFRNLWD